MRIVYLILWLLFFIVSCQCQNASNHLIDNTSNLFDSYIEESRDKKIRKIETRLDCLIEDCPKFFFYPSPNSDSLNLLCSFSMQPYVWENSFGCDYDYKTRNVVEIRVDRYDSVLFEYKTINSLNEVKDTLIILFTNPLDNDMLAEKRLKKIDIIGERKVTKTSFVIDAMVVPDSLGAASSWSKIKEVVNVIFEANMELRRDSAVSIFNKEYNELSYLEQKSLSQLLPVAIWIYPNEEYGITHTPSFK